MNTKEIQQQLKDNQEIILSMEERITELENGAAKMPEINIPDYSMELNTIISELRSLNQEDKTDRVLTMLS